MTKVTQSGYGAHTKITVQEEGIFVGTKKIINFVGNSLLATLDEANNRINITGSEPIANVHIANTANPHSVTNVQVIPSYETPWINRSDWTNVHMGSNPGLNVDSNVTHNLNAPLSDILVKVFISTDGTDANSLEVGYAGYSDQVSGTLALGFTTYEVDSNNIKVQTATSGIERVTDAGVIDNINTENWYYKIVVYRLK